MTALELDAQALVDPLLIHHLDEDWAIPCEAGNDHEDAMGCRGTNPAVLILWAVVCCPKAPRVALWW